MTKGFECGNPLLTLIGIPVHGDRRGDWLTLQLILLRFLASDDVLEIADDRIPGLLLQRQIDHVKRSAELLCRKQGTRLAYMELGRKYGVTLDYGLPSFDSRRPVLARHGRFGVGNPKLERRL